MNQRIGWRNTFGVGHEANVVEIDFSKMASVGAVDYFQSVGAAVTFAFSPGFAAGLIPKGYIPVLPQVWR